MNIWISQGSRINAKPEVIKFQIEIVVDKGIIELQIVVNNTFTMNKLQTVQVLYQIEPANFLIIFVLKHGYIIKQRLSWGLL